MNEPAQAFPKGMNNIYLFTVFNAFSYQIVLSSPMVLYAKSLGASATVLGIIGGMTALLVVFQIPAARHVARFGYKRFVAAGWGTRVLFIGLMSLVPFSGTFLDATTRLSLLLMLLFGFNLARGISSCAWMPWITALIPSSIRGKYLLRDAAFLNLASFIVFVLAGFSLGTNPRPWQFGALFGFSAAMGAASLIFLKRIPETDTPDEVRTSSTPVPWGAIIRHPPFRKLLAMNVCWAVAYGGLNTFIVAFLKTETSLVERDIMFVTSVAFLGGISSLWLLQSRLDRLGSKPVLSFSMLTWILILGVWVLLAARVIAPKLIVLLPLLLVMGLASVMVNLANTRLAMATMPPMGRSHFFALFSVLTSVTLGLSPILWGIFIDAFRFLEFSTENFEWNRYTLFFMAVAGAFGLVLAMVRRLEEPEAASLDALLRDLLKQVPLRVFWIRFWPRH